MLDSGKHGRSTSKNCSAATARGAAADSSARGCSGISQHRYAATERITPAHPLNVKFS